jgi:hypothetical protein
MHDRPLWAIRGAVPLIDEGFGSLDADGIDAMAEHLRALRTGLEGEIRRSQFEDQTTRVLCYNPVANAIITWNAV